MSKRRSNKSVKQMILPMFERLLDKAGKLGCGNHKLYLNYCEYDGKLKVFNHWEQPYPILEGVVSETDGGFELGIISLTARELKVKKPTGERK